MHPLRRFLAGIFFGIALFIPVSAVAQNLTSLQGWYSPSRGDYHTTSHPSWQGRPGETRSPDYAFQGIEAQILTAPSGALPSGTKRLTKWWSTGRKDNITLSHPSWVGRPGGIRSPDYRFSATEGLVFDKPFAGTVPLYHWWSSGKQNNLLSTSQTFNPDAVIADPRRAADGYQFVGIDSWAYPRAFTELARGSDPRLFGFDATPVTGQIPVLTLLVLYKDSVPGTTFPASPDNFYTNFLWGRGGLNIADYFREMSGQRFTWTNAGVLSVDIDMDGKDFIAMAAKDRDRMLLKMVEDRVDFASFDRPDSGGRKDGVITKDELMVIYYVPDDPADKGSPCGGQSRNFPADWTSEPPFRLDGVTLQTTVGALGWNGELKVVAEELMHSRGGFTDLYGPFHTMNARASVFSGSSCRGNAAALPAELDPWHRMLAGWLRPRVVPITQAGGSATLYAAQTVTALRPHGAVLFYDPRRGYNEFFLVEYRNPAPRIGGGYDSGAPAQGIALWYVQHDGVKPNRQTRVIRIEVPHAGENNANYLLAPPRGHWYGIPEVGRATFWDARDGEAILRWRDGTDSLLRMRFATVPNDSVTSAIAWRHKDTPFYPRLDRVWISAPQADGSYSVSLRGSFPVNQQVKIYAIDTAGSETELGRLNVGAKERWISFRSRDPLPAGDFQIVVEGPSITLNGTSIDPRSNGFFAPPPV